ncbi:MAG: hypothetical protein ACYS8Z_02665 [Planctomycetota bacterium]
MKKRAELRGWLLFIVFSIVFVTSVLLMKERRLTSRVQSIVSLENQKIEECVIEVLGRRIEGTDEHSHVRTDITLLGSEAADFGRHFARIAKKYCTEVLVGDRVSFMFDHQITFREGNYAWIFQFGYVPHEGLIEYELRTPSDAGSPLSYGTMILRKEAGPELENLIERKLAKE